METAAFCYFGLLKAPDRLEKLLHLLPEAERAACERLLASLRSQPPDQVRGRWETERAAERLALETTAQARAGGRLAVLPGRVRALLLRRTRRHTQEP